MLDNLIFYLKKITSKIETHRTSFHFDIQQSVTKVKTGTFEIVPIVLLLLGGFRYGREFW